MNEDPYRPPLESPEIEEWHDSAPQQPGEAPALVVEHLRHTRPWVKFCSLAGYITAGFILIIAAMTARKMLGSFPLLSIILLASFYLVLAVLFIIPSLRLSRYERSITRLNISHRIEDLEQAIAHQRTFWTQMGIMILIMLILYLVTIGISAIVLLSGKI
ncbi:hypothetical protein JIN77_02865 [Verrucomicrobiaceae bacterium R5-34]|uniref:Uncharacterized protein n=1 Tax=Oceaniferula flava TaxID=2800421 RepID=A0AAE2VCX7_9BACT|nr:hypothetical protein [Oceaniferula flavus]MBK1829654.1 hypothetical protein [Verrucomicrobiaceae bacterium R5-34]MBK1853844.1 hypothetical protein [Oceaniferula flavus]MBM1135150.1 hypothetical protein [Oceaniferula flavus]